MLENNFAKVDQTETCIQEPASNFLDELWTKPPQALEKVNCPLPNPERLLDKETREFEKELREAMFTGDFGSEFKEAASKIAERCRKDPAYEEQLEKQLGTSIEVSKSSITFDNRFQPGNMRFPGNQTAWLEVPLNGDPVKGHAYRNMCGMITEIEISPQEAAQRIFNPRNFRPNPNPFPIY